MKRFAVDWSQCVLNIQNAGVCCGAQAMLVGHKDKGQFLQRIARGDTKRMEFVTGVLLLDLHLTVCPDKHKALLA